MNKKALEFGYAQIAVILLAIALLLFILFFYAGLGTHMKNLFSSFLDIF